MGWEANTNKRKKTFPLISIIERTPSLLSTPQPSSDDDVPLIKKYIVHAAFFSLMGAVAWQSNMTAATDRNSLLYALVAGEEIVEGPLDPAAYAGTDTPGVGGDRLAALDAGIGIDLLTI